jgi:hypothetical protein
LQLQGAIKDFGSSLRQIRHVGYKLLFCGDDNMINHPLIINQCLKRENYEKQRKKNFFFRKKKKLYLKELKRCKIICFYNKIWSKICNDY